VGASLAIAALAGIALTVLYPDSYQQDAGHHYIAARWAWRHPETIVTVWNRPLFTFLYAFPAQLGYPAAKLFTFAIALVTAHQTYRLANDLRIDRAWFVIPLIFLQPTFTIIAADTMTEPLFALLFVVALRLHTAGRTIAGMIVASFLVTVRPEGFFLGVLWGVWVLTGTVSTSGVESVGITRRPPRSTVLLLATGSFAWWLSALVLSGDPLFILHSWPGNWGFDSVYGRGKIWIYFARLPEIAGLVLLIPFLAGLWWSLRRRDLWTLTSSFLVLFGVHTFLRVTGWFGSAGYARYFVCVAPAIAILTLVGWNGIAARVTSARPCVARPLGAVTLAVSAIVTIFYVDMAGFYGRDAWAVTEMHRWFRDNPRPVTRLIWSQAYMNVLFDRDPAERPAMFANRVENLAMLRQSPAGTLVFWDDEVGNAWYQMTAPDIEAAGYERLLSRSYVLDGWLREGRWLAPWSPRKLDVHLFYKNK
jgi:hypothetical protein